jgi:plastocyanin
MLFVFAVLLPPFDDIAQVDLSFHMLQHVAVVVAGAMIANSLVRRGAVHPRPGWTPRLLLSGVAAALVYWHLPSSWDAAVLNPLVHAAEHLTFLLVGMAIGSFLQALSDSAKISSLLAAFFGHMAYAAFLVAPWDIQVYPLFSVANQANLGWSLLLTGWTFLAVVSYLVRKNPAWLQGPSGKAAVPVPQKPAAPGREWPGRAKAAVSIALILVLAVYFAAAGLVIEAAGSPRQGATVYIVETPISWQYSPRNITVVIGVNNTVTWVSRSTSFDTITSDGGLFESGPIRPGSSFTHAFASPGDYGYHCAYHPWMVGRVTVVPAR